MGRRVWSAAAEVVLAASAAAPARAADEPFRPIDNPTPDQVLSTVEQAQRDDLRVAVGIGAHHGEVGSVETYFDGPVLLVTHECDAAAGIWDCYGTERMERPADVDWISTDDERPS